MADDLETRFEQAVNKVRNAPDDGSFKPSNEFRLKMYALYRQATDGDVTGKRPGMLKVVERAKYDAWSKAQGMPRDKAMAAYIEQVDAIETEHG